VESTEALLDAFDERARTEAPSPPAGVWYEHDGPLLRVVGEERGFISAPCRLGFQPIATTTPYAWTPPA
jgi:hypothetical protein